MEIGGSFCQILKLGRGLLLRDGEYWRIQRDSSIGDGVFENH